MFIRKPNKEEVKLIRTQAKANAEYNAKIWRNKNASDYSILMRGDSSIKADCPQGDGWATVDLRKGTAQSAPTIKLKCSTVSGSIGCMTANDFKKREAYSSQDGSCNKEIPFPLPKIVK